MSSGLEPDRFHLQGIACQSDEIPLKGAVVENCHLAKNDFAILLGNDPCSNCCVGAVPKGVKGLSDAAV